MLGLESLSKIFIVTGIVLIVAGSVFFMFSKIPWFGRLPGDVIIQRENFTFYFPVVTMIILSAVVTVIFNIVGRR